MKEAKKSSRIIALDLMRGYFLVIILFDHLRYFPNGLDWMSGRGQLYVSAAEGFFFISGIVLGIVRGRKLIDKPFVVTLKLLLKRAVQIYLTAIILFFIFTFIGWLFINNPGLKPGIRPITENFWDILINAFKFNYIYGWADYLRLYAIYLFLAPLAMLLLRKGKWYIVLLLSLYSWYYFKFSTLQSAELSQVYSWQIIFFGGIILGYYFDKVKDFWYTLSSKLRKSTVIFIVTLSIITMVSNFIFVVWGNDLLGKDLVATINTQLQSYFNKERLPMARIGLFLVWFWASFWLFDKLKIYFIKYLGWLLIPFGTNSLYIYTIEAFIIFGINLILPLNDYGILLNLIITLGCLAVTWLSLKSKLLMKIIPR